MAGEVPRLVALPAHTPSERLRLLLRLSETLAATTSVDQIAESITDIARQFFGAVFGGVAVIDADRTRMRYLTLHLLPEDIRHSRRMFPLRSTRPAAVAARERRAVFVESIERAGADLDADTVAAIRASGGTATAYLPMLLADRSIGALALMWAEEVRFRSEDRHLLWALARYTAQAVDRAQLLAEHREVARTLQAALLPVLPDVPWLRMAGVYRPANAAVSVGGDWYDAFLSTRADEAVGRDDVLTVVVGDVAGHDTHAAAEMGRLQAKLRALAIDAPDEPHRLLERLDRVMTANVHNRLATAITANLVARPDATMSMSWSNAGHLPPLVLEPGTPPYFLQRRPDLLLGMTGTPATRTTHQVVLPAGTTVLLFTDGLIERRGHDNDARLRRLAGSADTHRDLCLPQLVATLMDDAAAIDHEDDTVLFAFRVPPAFRRGDRSPL